MKKYKTGSIPPSDLLITGRKVALELIAQNGSTHVRAVCDEMISRGIVGATRSRAWIGPLFRTDDFVATSETFQVPRGRSTRPVKIWKVKL